MNPLVSIIIPTYNRAHLIGETLDSLLAQTYTNWECIIVDDGSIDSTAEIVNEYLIKDNRFLFIKRAKTRIKGASTCRNIGLEHANGEYIQFLDSDDLITPNKILEQINLLKYNDEAVILTCKWSRFNKIMGDSVNYENLDSYNNFNDIPLFLEALANSKGYFPLHAYLIKKSIINKTGLWNEYLCLNDDSEFLIRLFCNTDKIYFASNAIAYYRWTGNENISYYDDYQKVDDAINSWKLIEILLKIRFKTKKINYVDIMKISLFINVKNSFPELTFKHNDFFEKQLAEIKLTLGLKEIIKKKLNKLWKISH